MNTNKLSATLSAEDLAAALGHLQSIRDLFPFLQGLSAEDKLKIKKAGDNRLAFIQKAYTYAQQHPEVLPGTLNLPEFGKDVTFINVFLQFIAAQKALGELCDDTETLGEFEAFEQARDVYDAFKRANRSGDYNVIVNDLATTFEGQGKTKSKKPPTP